MDNPYRKKKTRNSSDKKIFSNGGHCPAEKNNLFKSIFLLVFQLEVVKFYLKQGAVKPTLKIFF